MMIPSLHNQTSMLEVSHFKKYLRNKSFISSKYKYTSSKAT